MKPKTINTIRVLEAAFLSTVIIIGISASIVQAQEKVDFVYPIDNISVDEIYFKFFSLNVFFIIVTEIILVRLAYLVKKNISKDGSYKKMMIGIYIACCLNIFPVLLTFIFDLVLRYKL